MEGEYENEMTLNIKGERGSIEWIFEKDGIQDSQGIGLYLKGDELVDYDGVFELPKEAIELLKAVGVRVSDDF